MSTNISIYDGTDLIGVVCGDSREAWHTAQECVNSLAHDAGPARRESAHREWYRTPGRVAYQRSGFLAVNTFQFDANPSLPHRYLIFSPK